MTDQPNTWCTLPLSTLAALKTGPFGSTLHKSDYVEGGIPIVNPTHILRGKIVPSRSTTVSAATAARLPDFQLRTNDVVLGRRGEMGRCAVVGPEQKGWLCGTGSLIIRPKELILPRYLQRFLSNPDTVRVLEGESVGSTMVNLNQGVLQDLSVPVPPISEQERIADKLDELFVRVGATREKLERVPELLKRFREAVLEAAVSGRLTEEDEIASSKSRDGIPATWLRTPFSDLIESIRTGTTEVPTDNATKFPVLRSSSVRPLSVDIQDRRYLTAQQSTNKGNFIQASDLLFTRLSGSVEYVGNCAMVRTDASESIQYPDRLFRVRLKDPDQARYIEIAFASRSVRKQIEEQVKSSAGHQRISTNAITRAVLRIPPPADQAEIVRRVDQLFALADVVERQLRKATVQVEKLAPSLLAKAFRGELVPQDPNDEPASVLLDRIRKAREEVGATAKHVSRTTTKKVTAERLMPRATRSVKRKPNKVAARSGSPMSQRLISKRK